MSAPGRRRTGEPDAAALLVPRAADLLEWVQQRFGLRPDRFVLKSGPAITVEPDEVVQLVLRIALTQEDLDSLQAVWGANPRRGGVQVSTSTEGSHLASVPDTPAAGDDEPLGGEAEAAAASEEPAAEGEAEAEEPQRRQLRFDGIPVRDHAIALTGLIDANAEDIASMKAGAEVEFRVRGRVVKRIHHWRRDEDSGERYIAHQVTIKLEVIGYDDE